MFDPARQIEEYFAVLGTHLECGRRPTFGDLCSRYGIEFVDPHLSNRQLEPARVTTSATAADA
jgi:hypothetical protein